MARRPSSAPARGRPQAQQAGSQSEAERKLQLIGGFHAQKVSALLSSQNKLQCENALLRKQELEHRQTSRRGPAFLRAETELSRQDAMICALSKLLPRDRARNAARAALTAGPRRVPVKTRLDLKWDIEDEREKLVLLQQKIRSTRSAKTDEAQLSQLMDGDASQKSTMLKDEQYELERLKEQASDLLMENQTHQVENNSLERVLQRGAEVFTRICEQQPQASAVIYGPTVLGERLLSTQEELLELQRTRSELERVILQSGKELKEKEATYAKQVQEVEKVRRQAAEVQKDAEVAAQAQLMRAQKKVAEKRRDLEGAQGRLKAIHGERETETKSVERRQAVSSGDSARREFTLRRELQAEWKKEEEAMAEKEAEVRDYARITEQRIRADLQEAKQNGDEHRAKEQEHKKRAMQTKYELETCESEHKQEESSIVARRQAVQAMRTEKDEHSYIEAEMQSLQPFVEMERQRHRYREQDLEREITELRRRLREKYQPAKVPFEKRRADLGEEIKKAQIASERKVAKAKQALEVQKEEWQVQEEAAKMYHAAKEERAEAAAKTVRVNYRLQILLAAQREREAAARDSMRAHAQIECWLSEYAATKRHADAQWDRAAAIADLERWNSQQGLHLDSDAQTQRDHWMSELRQAAAKERAAVGKDIAVVRAQIARWTSKNVTVQNPDAAHKAYEDPGQRPTVVGHDPRVPVVHQPEYPMPHDTQAQVEQRRASKASQAHSGYSATTGIISESDSIIPIQIHHHAGQDQPALAEPPADVTFLREEIQMAEQELTSMQEVQNERHAELVSGVEKGTPASMPHAQVVVGAAEELHNLLSRAAGLEDVCLDLEQQHSRLEHQVKAAQVLIRRLQCRERDTNTRGCPHCKHCRDLQRSIADTSRRD